MKYTIYRGSWRRGGRKNWLAYGETKLLNSQNMMCCLGQIECQRGVSLESLFNIELPESLYNDIPEDDTDFLVENYIHPSTAYKLTKDTLTATRMIEINDDVFLSDQDRESQLTTEFSKLGHELEFLDGVAPWFNSETQHASI